MSLLRANDVHKNFGGLAALKNVDLIVEAHQFHGLIGPNGSGKSTLLKCIAGAELDAKGSSVFQDQDIIATAVSYTHLTRPPKARCQSRGCDGCAQKY